MCGLVGVAGAIDRKVESVFRTLLILDTIRGDHSTGVAFIDKWDNKRNEVVKEIGAPASLFRNQDYINADKRGPFKALIGHNRFATRGAVSAANAHPFIAGHIIGAHNGTLENKWQFPDQDKFATDSETFFNMVYKEGIKKAVENCAGAWAFVFFNEEENTINLIRNKERTLYFCYTKDKKTLLWASEEWMLSVACNRVGLEIHKIFMLRENTLFSTPIKDGNIAKEKTTPLSGRPPVVVTYVGLGTKSNRSSQNQVLLEVIGKQKFSSTEYYVLSRLVADKSAPEDEEILMYTGARTTVFQIGDIIKADLNIYDKSSYALPHSARIASPADIDKVGSEEEFLSHKGEAMTKEEWMKKYSYCSWCSSDIKPEEENLLLSTGDILCPVCLKDEDVKQFVKSW